MIDKEILDKWNKSIELYKETDSEVISAKPEWLKFVKDLMFGPVGLYKGNAICACAQRFKTEKEVDDFFEVEVPKLEEHVILYRIQTSSVAGPNDFCPRLEYIVRYATVHPNDFKEPAPPEPLHFDKNDENVISIKDINVNIENNKELSKDSTNFCSLVNESLSANRIFINGGPEDYFNPVIEVPKINWKGLRDENSFYPMIAQLIECKRQHVLYPDAGYDSLINTLREKINSFGEEAIELLQKAETKQRIDCVKFDLRRIANIENNTNLVKELIKFVEHPYIVSLMDVVKRATGDKVKENVNKTIEELFGKDLLKDQGLKEVITKFYTEGK